MATEKNIVTLHRESRQMQHCGTRCEIMDRLLHTGNAAKHGRQFASFEIEADKELSTSRNLSKIWLMLGLMGALIPMGPAIVRLSTGDIASMACNMQVAFATTLVCLFFLRLSVLKQRWVEKKKK